MGFSAHIPGAEISTHKASLLTDTGLTVDMDKQRVCSIRAVQVTKMNRDFILTLDYTGLSKLYSCTDPCSDDKCSVS